MESYVIEFSFSGTEVWGLAELLSISFLRLSTSTYVKKNRNESKSSLSRRKCDEQANAMTISSVNIVIGA